MRDIKRIPSLLKRLRTVWEKCPDIRLGQLMFIVQNRFGAMLFDTEDEEIISFIEATINSSITNENSVNKKIYIEA